MRAQATINNGNRPVAIDLFCGAGGLSFGLQEAGFRVALGLDFDSHALRTFEANHADAAILNRDVREVTGKDILAAAGVDHIDLLAGGPSCQGFSTHGKRLVDDPRNFLYREFLRLVDELQPTTVLMENVKGLIISGKGAFKRQVVDSFESLGYSVEGQLLHAADFGVPQRRERVIFMASKLGSTIKFPDPTHGPSDSPAVLGGQLEPYVTVDQAIGDLPGIAVDSRTEPLQQQETAVLTDYQKEMRRETTDIWNHISRPVSDLALEIISQVKPGNGLRTIPPERLPSRFQRMRRISTGELRRDCTTLYYRLSPSAPSYTITCNFKNVSSGAFTHPSENRAITAREAARLQSFPDAFRFYGSAIPRQIGNAVPPLLGKVVGEAVLDHLRTHDDGGACQSG
ncbi:DNA cytosine methyltransferase [Yimella radicis]